MMVTQWNPIYGESRRKKKRGSIVDDCWMMCTDFIYDIYIYIYYGYIWYMLHCWMLICHHGLTKGPNRRNMRNWPESPACFCWWVVDLPPMKVIWDDSS